jgi:hypothetical protein
MYRTFRKFEQDMKKNLRQDEISSGKDQIERESNSYNFVDSDGESVILYSKVRMIEKILQVYDEIALDTIARKLGISEKVDYSKIDKYLHKAIYLSNGIAYIDEMEVMRNVILYSSNDLVEMFCFILHEIQKELEQITDERVKLLSTKFREKHLSSKQSLFDEYTFRPTISLLKDVLDKIEKQTAYKDNDFWRIFEAIEIFLYGELDLNDVSEEGIFWGISKFDTIWEQMCSTFVFRNFSDIFYADTNVIVSGINVGNKTVGRHRIFVKDGFYNPFYIEFQGMKRWFRPDLLRRPSVENNVEIKREPKTINGRINFIVKKKNNNDQANQDYEKIIDKLKRRMKKIPGSAVHDDNKFKSYTAQELEDVLTDMSGFLFFDWKYHPVTDYMQNLVSSKVEADIIKQLVYEYSLQQMNDKNIESRFVIPYYYNKDFYKKNRVDDIGEFIDEKSLAEFIKTNKIRVFKADFNKIQEEYLAEKLEYS